MRRIINSTFITLDGVVEGPHLWPSLGGEEDSRSYQLHIDLIQSCDAVVMGRRTYEGFAAAWPTRSGDPYSDRLNAMRKYVVSTTLTAPEWNNTQVIEGDVVAELTALKHAPGNDIVQYGFGDVSRLMLEHGLLDEIRLWVHPLILGSGDPGDLLFGATSSVGLALVESTQLRDGVVVLRYEVERVLARAA